MVNIIRCPECQAKASLVKGNRYRCNSHHCRIYFREENAYQPPVQVAKTKYQGKPAGRIEIHGYRWGSTRLG